MRTANKNNSLHITKNNKKTYLTNYKLFEIIKQHLLKKGFFFEDNPYIVKQKNLYTFKLGLFYRTKLLIRYRKMFVKKNTDIFNKHLFIKNKKTNILMNIKCLNRNLNKDMIRTHYSFFKFHKNMFFERNNNLWLDFIKTLDLIINKQLSIETLLYLIASIFKYLNKRKHSRFKLFIFQIFKHIIKVYPDKIIGLRLSINGRLQAKPRASSVKIQSGKLELTKCSNLLKKSQTHVYTPYGAFGIKLYINYKV